MTKKLNLIALILILFLAFALRVYKVGENPPALNWDETSIAYNAYSLLKTGRDEWGKFLPIHFLSFGEYKLPVQIYGSIPGIAIFGLNEFGVRITPVFYGTLTVLLIFFLARSLFNNFYIGLFSAFFLATSPWHIHLTRGSFESSFAAFWVVLGIWFLVKGFNKPIYLIMAMLPMALAIYTYNTARVFVPIFLVVTALIYFKDLIKFKQTIIIAAFIFGILMLPLIPFVLSGEGGARYKLVSVTDDPGLVPRINENRGNSKLPEPLPKLIHNKPTYVSFYFIQNYLAHFTPEFLFLTGAPHKQHHVQNIGQLYWVQAPFLVLGLYFIFKKKNKFRWILILWILITYIPIALTQDSIPHALRSLIASGSYQIISAAGLFYFFHMLNKKKLRIFLSAGSSILTVLFIFQFIGYLNNYYNKYPILHSRDWQYGYKQVVEFINQEKDNYDLVVFTRHYGEPHIFTLFYSKYDPLKFQTDPNLVRFETFDWVRVLKFNKFYFPDLGDSGTSYLDILNQYPDKKILFVGKPSDFPENQIKLKTIKLLNGSPVFEVVSKI